MFNRHYHVIDDDIIDTKMKGSFDLVTCVSVLEHIIRHDHALRNMFALLKDDGHIIITCPYHERAYCPNVYAPPGSSYGQSSAYVCQAYSRENVQAWLEQSNAEIVEQEYWRCWDGEYWTVGSQTLPP